MATVSSWFSTVGETTVLYPFLKVDGMPEPVAEEFDRVVRSGVPGIGIWRKAPRGKPFEITSTIDVLNMTVGKSLQADYLTRIGDVLDFWWQEHYVGRAFIHHCKPLPIKRLSGTVGGLNAGGALVQSVWQIEGLV